MPLPEVLTEKPVIVGEPPETCTPWVVPPTTVRLEIVEVDSRTKAPTAASSTRTLVRVLPRVR